MNVTWTPKSGNVKIGPMPATIAPRSTCPGSCPLKDNGCYAAWGPMSWTWNRLDRGEIGIPWAQFLDNVKALEDGTIWRHGQAGDLPGVGDRIATRMLADMVEANKGKRGYTYTHKPPTGKNLEAIRHANDNGFTINLSADNLEEADRFAKLGPTVVTLPKDGGACRTPNGRKVIVCPAQASDIDCKTCGLCQRANRSVIVGFLAHGSKAKEVGNG